MARLIGRADVAQNRRSVIRQSRAPRDWFRRRWTLGYHIARGHSGAAYYGAGMCERDLTYELARRWIELPFKRALFSEDERAAWAV